MRGTLNDRAAVGRVERGTVAGADEQMALSIELDSTLLMCAGRIISIILLAGQVDKHAWIALIGERERMGRVNGNVCGVG